VLIAAVIAAAAAVVVVWRAGMSLSRDADALAGATPLGRAFVGVVLLGVATSLPELATTVTAGVLGNPNLVIGNLMGGVALQVVVLAAADAFGSRRPLTRTILQPALLVQHVVLLLLLSMAIAGMTVGEPFALLGVGVWPVLLALVYAGGLLLLR
jgi:cation:H+ antiporter